jgi:serine phosphatase RsbU (regulator of sigma subunit)
VDEPLSERVEALAVHHGLKDCVAKVFGKRERYVVIACEDKTGSAISNPEFIGALEKALGVRLSSPQYYRKGDMALMESHADSTYMLVGKGVGVARRGGVSGDKMSFVDTPDGYSLALLTDGMGTGKSAKRVSDFASEIIAELLKSGRDKTTSLHLLNKLLNQRPDESAVAVDLFIFDRILGEGTFVKSGGAPSYIKRGNSVYRIKSETAPLGSMPMLDCEKIRVEVSEGDFIIMLSDGVSQSAEDSPWLLDFLSKPYDGDESSLARDILDLSKQNHNGPLDDMSVLVAKIRKV